MIERAGIALLIIGLVVSSYQVITHWQTARITRGNTGNELLDMLRPDIPAVIYFWSEACAPCKTVQKPALEELQIDLGPEGIQVVAVNAVERPDLADAWGVLGLPTTFIVDRAGQPRRVNHGVVRADHLKQQVRLLEDARSAG
jgi:thiol-disulfide isomerase/thioredoxin